MKWRDTALRAICLPVASALALTACVTLISPYDEKTDELATALQRKMSTHIEALDGAESPACLYPNFRSFYDEVRVDVSALDVRARSLDMNDLTANQVTELQSMVNNFESLHRLSSERNQCLSAGQISPVRRAFDSAIGAVLKLELAKKRGK